MRLSAALHVRRADFCPRQAPVPSSSPSVLSSCTANYTSLFSAPGAYSRAAAELRLLLQPLDFGLVWTPRGLGSSQGHLDPSASAIRIACDGGRWGLTNHGPARRSGARHKRLRRPAPRSVSLSEVQAASLVGCVSSTPPVCLQLLLRESPTRSCARSLTARKNPTAALTVYP